MYTPKSSRSFVPAVIVVSVLFIGVLFGMFSMTKTGNAQTPTQAPTPMGTASPSPAPATTTPSALTGWAWSSTIGWISLSSTTDSASTINYGVSINNRGSFYGFAWSPIIGWIDFNPADMAHCPAGTFSTCAPRVNPATGAVTGWIRACAATVNKDCQSADLNDGWDGWIELSGPNHISPRPDGTGGVTYNLTTGSFDGFAWGSDVVGWINFDANDVPIVGSGSTITASNPPGLNPCNPTYQVCGSGGGSTPIVVGGCTMYPSTLPDTNGNLVTTAKATNVGGGNGSFGSYTYQWSNGSGFSGGYTSSSTHTFAYTQGTSNQTYTPLLQIKDTAGNVSNPISCNPPVTVNSNQPNTNLIMTLDNAVQPSGELSLQGTPTLVVKQNSTAYANINASGIDWRSFTPQTNTAYWTAQGFGPGALTHAVTNIPLNTSVVGDYSMIYTYSDTSDKTNYSGSIDLQVIPAATIEEQ